MADRSGGSRGAPMGLPGDCGARWGGVEAGSGPCRWMEAPRPQKNYRGAQVRGRLRLEAVPKEAGMAPPSLGQSEAAGLQRIPPQVILETGSGLWTQTWMQTGHPCSAWGKSV